MLESILDRFQFSKSSALPKAEPQPVVAPIVPPPAILPIAPKKVEPTVCGTCAGKRFWQPRGSTSWICSQCEPPPTMSLVGAELGVPKVISRCAYVVGPRLCAACSSRMVTESTWSDGLATFECSTCQREIDSQLIPW